MDDGTVRSSRVYDNSLLRKRRSPVVIFLSDGECGVQDATIYDLCRSAARLGCAFDKGSVIFLTFIQKSPCV